MFSDTTAPRVIEERQIPAIIERRPADVRPGSRLGPYEIIQKVGEGGMGEVYKARDTRLARLVAIKISKMEFSGRFEMEARATAALNHAHICTLHDVGPNYLVMEYVEGKLLMGPLPLKQALHYAIQICSALESAHRKGIVHRDLKPSNIMLTKSGVKVLDFGLAKVRRDPQHGRPPVETLTGKNEIVGTLRYMSPEQLRGTECDGRTDIFSFGLVLYEMLTGKLVFDGGSAADVIGAILERPAPSMTGLAPPALDRLFQRCLNKDPDDRWQSFRDLRAELEWIDAGDSSVNSARLAEVRRANPWPWTIGAMALCSIAWFSWWMLARPRGESPPVTRTAITMADSTFDGPVLSRDGRRLLYSQIGIPPRLWIRMMDQLEGSPIPGSENGIFGTLSPDGQWVVYLRGPEPNSLAKIPVTGGTATILSSPANFSGMPLWTDDNSIIAASGEGLVRLSAAGGPIEVLTSTDRGRQELGHFEPSLLPAGRGILFSVATGSSLDQGRENAQLAVFDLKTRKHKMLGVSGSSPSYVPTGHLVYRRGASLLAARFDLSRLSVTGTEKQVTEGLATGLGPGSSPYSFSQSGYLVYRHGDEKREKTTLAWMDPSGGIQGLPEQAHSWQTAPLSPDGRKIVGELSEAIDGISKERIIIYDIDRGVLTPLTPSRSDDRDFYPIWSPDGQSVTFTKNRDGKFGIYRMPADSSGHPELLVGTAAISYPSSWSRDGKTLAFYQLEQSKHQIFLIQVSAAGKAGQPRRLHPDSTGAESQPAISPDGKWIAYTSNHSGRFEIYVSRFDGTGGIVQVSNDGGRLPKWSPSGRDLYYLEPNPRRLMAADVLSESTFKCRKPRPLFIVRNDALAAYYDVAPDGRRFLVVAPPHNGAAATASTTFVLVTGWFDELLQKFSPKN